LHPIYNPCVPTYTTLEVGKDVEGLVDKKGILGPLSLGYFVA